MKRFKFFILIIFGFTFVNASEFQCEFAINQWKWNNNSLEAEIESGIGEKFMIQTYAKEALKNAILMKKTCNHFSYEDKQTLSKVINNYRGLLNLPISPTTNKVSGKSIYKTCRACHGDYAEKKALGASQIIAGWDITKIESALKGYKDGSYGGAMKGVMKGQVAVLSDIELKLVSEYIHSLQ